MSRKKHKQGYLERQIITTDIKVQDGISVHDLVEHLNLHDIPLTEVTLTVESYGYDACDLRVVHTTVESDESYKARLQKAADTVHAELQSKKARLEKLQNEIKELQEAVNG